MPVHHGDLVYHAKAEGKKRRRKKKMSPVPKRHTPDVSSTDEQRYVYVVCRDNRLYISRVIAFLLHFV